MDLGYRIGDLVEATTADEVDEVEITKVGSSGSRRMKLMNFFGTLLPLGRTITSLKRFLQNNSRYNPLDFGAVGDGAHDDTAAINAAIAAARVVGGTVVFTPGKYVVTSPLNMTLTSAQSLSSVRPLPILVTNESTKDSGQAVILPKHFGPVFDCTGSYSHVFRGLNIGIVDGYAPLCIWLLARNGTGSNGGSHSFEGCFCSVQTIRSVVYSYGSETNNFTDCRFYNSTTNAVIFKWTAGNIDAVASDYSDIATGSQSNIVTFIRGGEFQARGSNGKVFYLDRHSGLNVDGVWVAAMDENSSDGHSVFYIDNSVGDSSYLNIENVWCENAGFLPKYGIFASNERDGAALTGLRVRNMICPNRTALLSVGNKTRFLQNHLENVTENGTTNGVHVTDFELSYFINCGCDLTCDTLRNSVVMGLSAQVHAGQVIGGIVIDATGNILLGSSTSTLGTSLKVGVGGTGVFSLAVGVVPAAVASRGQIVVEPSGKLMYVSPAGTVTELAPS